MKEESIEAAQEAQRWLNPAERALDTISSATVEKSGHGLRNFLHGVWLGHPLHPATVEIPIGALTAATALDLLGAIRRTHKYEAGSDVALSLGLATATLAAASGLADWSQSEGKGRKTGVLHALLNGGATLAYLVSWFLRLNNRRPAAVNTGVFGWVLLAASAYMGGKMVYNHRVGVDHAERPEKGEFKPVFPESELPENEPHRVEVDGVGVLVIKQHGQIFAIGEKCAHFGGPLSEGEIEEGAVTCPWHGSKFRLSDGAVINGPSAYAQPCFAARVRDGQVEIRLGPKFQQKPVVL